MNTPLTDPDDLTGPLDRPLTRAEWDAANRFIRGMRDELEKETAAASRFAKELADVRILLDNAKTERDKALTEVWEREKQIDYLRAGVEELCYLTSSETIREFCEGLLRGDMPT
ncbi:MAG: hypothetical protein HRJ53_04895 [Acidobacteria bacterium Pan2503]|uniref:Uncharacterized protein n=1 Tax=Candidatus Acidiferrum panamense TaxID=2741543 RepID=A0A7V8SVX2_9BACT|nr:hypothetical protein [Candidatus Acidoferrum panamensis]